MLPAVPATPRPRPRVCAGLILAAALLAVGSVLMTGATAPAQAAPAATPPPCTTQFGDVPFGSAFYPYVRNLACGAVLSGYADGTFRPGNPVTRGQLAKIVANAANVNAAPGAQTFADVAPDNPFYAWIQRLAGQGDISGYTCGGPGEPCDAQSRPYFRPNAGATRGQIAKIVAGAAGFAEQPAGQTFADVPPTAPFYVWIERLAARGVINGYDCGGSGEPCDAANRPYFRPNAGATRGQVAKIVSNTFYPNAYPAQAMIGDALSLGLIDYGTSVLYRTYALYGDRHLPAQYIGTGSSGEDNSLFYLTTTLSNTIPPAILAQVRPYVERPDAPDSAFSTQVPSTATPTPPGGPGAPGGAKAARAPGTSVLCDAHGWAAMEDPAPYHFLAHARCSGLSADPDTVQILTDTLQLADTVWGPMTALMGTPIPDQGGDDAAIDIYIVEPFDKEKVDGRSLEISKGELAYAHPDAPLHGHASSGYIVMPRNAITQPNFRDTFIHEFFHVLQLAHNAQIGSGDPAGTYSGEYWFIEASAEWAAAHFDRTITNWPARWAGRQADKAIYDVWWPWFQSPVEQAVPLNLSVPGDDPRHNHEYMAFIWPYFMEQESGAAAIANAWRALENTTTSDQAFAAIDAQLPFADNFHTFAIRNLNQDYDGQNPIGTHYKDLDPLFPEGYNDQPPEVFQAVPVVQPSDPPTQFPIPTLQPLTAQYSDIGTVFGTGNPRRWELDFSGLGPEGDFDVDLLLKHTDGTWELRTGVDKNALVVICDVTEVRLILSNHDASAAVSGSYTARVLDEPCTCQIIEPYLNQPWDATYDLSYRKVGEQTDSTGYTRVTVDHSYHAAATLSHRAGSWVTGTLSSGVGTIADERYTRDPNGNEATRTLSGNGPPVVYDPSGLGPYSIGELAIQLDTCTYSVREQFAVTAVAQPGGESGTEPIGTVAIDGLPIGQSTALSGATDLPVRWLSYQIPFDHAGGYDIELFTILGEGNMGTAHFSWSFTPESLATPPAGPAGK